MSDWTLTLGLQNLRSQINAAFPDRDHASDGTIGDAAHAAESSSGHNPDDTKGSHAEWNGDPDSTPEVRAWDMDSDLRMPGVDAQMVVDHIRALPDVDNELRYMIYNRKIYKASAGWHPAPYSGPSPHTEHIHFDGAWSQAADNNTTFDYRLEAIPVALTADDKKWFTDTIDARIKIAVDKMLTPVGFGVNDKLGGTSSPLAQSIFNSMLPATPDATKRTAFWANQAEQGAAASGDKTAGK